MGWDGYLLCFLAFCSFIFVLAFVINSPFFFVWERGGDVDVIFN